MKISIAPRPTVPSLLVPALAPVLGPGSSVAGPGPPPAVATSRSRSRPRATLALLSAVEVSAELPRDRFQVHEVTKSRARALAHLILTAAGFTEVGDGRKLSVHWPTTEPTIVEIVDRPLRIFLSAELDINIANQMIAKIVAHVHLLDLTVLVLALDEYILEEVIVVLLHLFVRHIRNQMGAICTFCRVLRVHIKILQ